MLGTSISKNSLLLGLFALITAAILAGTQAGTQDRIAAAEREAAQRALLEIVPLDRHTNDLLMDTVPIEEAYWEALGLKNGGEVNIARDHGEPVAAIIPAVAPDGYSGDIKLIIGINADGSIAGVRALTHNETPGLGDKVDLKKSSWILSFNDKSLSNPGIEQWAVKKDGGDFDQFTGATITPRAVINQVKRALLYFSEAKPLQAKEETDSAPQATPSAPESAATGLESNGIQPAHNAQSQSQVAPS
ncbi:electron transport complex subunit RsxG [Aestuariicella hydrocarbonica]|uniref:Ion-translocating oxidoreductase complex subunit G n=1 Tax=Pseudomaricurvus hydrocarbonicus TaxID=1470433 RepID=A0A9E5JRQ5_9GAMM|nr:electron transport complex subunit RsxG [Aestuariicella hydrocarbonica]NHO64114.1 electron transport complex subunit RsxG [Aestuariicella hydrocarbonica]